MTALDYSLVILNGACNALERAKPTLKDVEEARDKAKKAHKLLDGAYNLMSEGCFTVAEDPNAAAEAAKGAPLFQPSGEPAPAAEASAAEPTELPTLGHSGEIVDAEIVGDARVITDDDFNALLDTWEGMVFEEGGGSLKEFKAIREAWLDDFEKDQDGATTRLLRWLVSNAKPWVTPADACELQGAAEVIGCAPAQPEGGEESAGHGDEAGEVPE